MEQIDVVFWGTRSYDVRTSATVDKKDFDAALESVGENNPSEMFVYLDNIGYEFEIDEMSPIEESITEMDLFNV